MARQPEERMSVSDRRRNRETIRRSTPPVALLLATQGSLVIVDPGRPETALQLAWALSPMIAILWLAWVQLDALRRADELQRQGQLESLAIAFGVTVIVALGGGLLDGAGIGDPRTSLQVTVGIGIVAWVTALSLKARTAS